MPSSWMCKKQISVSHSPTEAEIISLGVPTLDLWNLAAEAFSMHKKPT